jgi:hypothetical protein
MPDPDAPPGGKVQNPNSYTPPPQPEADPYVPPGSGPRTPAADDPWAAYRVGSNSAYDQATAIAEQFLSLMGYPTSVDAIDLVHQLLQAGLEYSAEQAYNWLFTQMSSDLQKAHPNAEFGMTFDTYVQQLNALKDQWSNFTGSEDIPPDVLRMAIDQGWTQQEMLDFLQKDKRYNNPAAMPWLHQGMGYRDVKNQFFQIYGKNPINPDQLASWWSFREGSQSIQGGAAAPITPGRGPTPSLPSQSETR